MSTFLERVAAFLVALGFLYVAFTIVTVVFAFATRANIGPAEALVTVALSLATLLIAWLFAWGLRKVAARAAR